MIRAAKSADQPPALRDRATVHNGFFGQILIYRIARLGERDWNAEPAFQGGIKRAALGGTDIPALSRAWERPEAMRVREVVESVIKREHSLVSGPGRQVGDPAIGLVACQVVGPARERIERGLKQLRSARVISAGHAFVQNLRRGHYKFGIEEPTILRVVAAFTELTRAI